MFVILIQFRYCQVNTIVGLVCKITQQQVIVKLGRGGFGPDMILSPILVRFLILSVRYREQEVLIWFRCYGRFLSGFKNIPGFSVKYATNTGIIVSTHKM